MIFASFHQGKEEIIFALSLPFISLIFPDIHRIDGGQAPPFLINYKTDVLLTHTPG
jgi:hypothetical protein